MVLCLCAPVIPVGLFVSVVLRNVHVLTLPGRLVVGKISPLDQVMYVVLFVNTDGEKKKYRELDRVLLNIPPVLSLVNVLLCNENKRKYHFVSKQLCHIYIIPIFSKDLMMFS